MAALDTSELGSTGTLIGAVMETAGHFMQSAFIDVLAGGLATSAGALLYLVGILSALTIIALGGKYKFGRWFLIGPVLFYALVFARVDSCGVVVRNGERVLDPEVIWDKTRGLANVGMISEAANALSVEVAENGNLCASNPARISAIFEMWNNLTSVTINSFVKLLRLEDRGAEFDFVTKVDRFTGIFTENIDDVIVKDLVSTIVGTKCGAAFATIHQGLAPNHSDQQRAAIDENLTAQMASIRVNPAEYPELQRIITERATKEVDTNGDKLYDCNELWGFATDVLKTHALEIFSDIARVEGIEDKDQRAAEVLERLGTKWSLAYDKDTKTLEVLQDRPALVGVINEKAVRLFIDQLRQLNPSLRKGQLNNTQYRSLLGDIGGNEELADSIRSSSATEEYREKGKFLQLMLALPYAQGVLLYFLAMLYPFFCMFAILPGRHETVMMWFGLWFWVKLWDFGFAVVMLIDEIMFTLLPHSPFIDNTTLADPQAAFKAALSVDPTYSVHIYYNILASCLAAVPILTAGAVKKGTGAILGPLNKSMNSFLGNPGGAFASYAGSRKAETNLATARQQQHNTMVDSLYRQFKNSDVGGEMIAATAMRAGMEVMKGGSPALFGELRQRALKDASMASTPEARQSYMDLAERYSNQGDAISRIAASTSAGKGFLAYLDAKVSQKERVAMAWHAYQVQADVYRQSTSMETEYLNADARQQGFYDHPFRASYPEAAYLNYIKEQNHLDWANVTATLGNEWWKSFNQITGSAVEVPLRDKRDNGL